MNKTIDEMGRLIKNRDKWRIWIDAVNPTLQRHMEEEEDGKKGMKI